MILTWITEEEWNSISQNSFFKFSLVVSFVDENLTSKDITGIETGFDNVTTEKKEKIMIMMKLI